MALLSIAQNLYKCSIRLISIQTGFPWLSLVENGKISGKLSKSERNAIYIRENGETIVKTRCFSIMELLIGLQESVNCKKTPIIITEERASLFVCLCFYYSK